MGGRSSKPLLETSSCVVELQHLSCAHESRLPPLPDLKATTPSEELCEFATGSGLRTSSVAFVGCYPLTAAMTRHLFQNALLVKSLCRSVFAGVMFQSAISDHVLFISAPGHASLAVSFWCGVIFARRGVSHIGVKLIGAGYLLLALSSVTFIAVRIIVEHWSVVQTSIRFGIVISGYCVMAFVFLCDETLWTYGLLLCAGCQMSNAIRLFMQPQTRARFKFIIISTALDASVSVALSVYFLKKRHLALKRAIEDIRPDRERYDRVWHSVLEFEAHDLLHVKSLVTHCTQRKVCQPTKDMNLLFALAESLDDWYQSVVAGWAASLGVCHKIAPVKSRARAFEKVDRSYKGDPSKVLDFVRSSLVCRTVGEAGRCLEFAMKNSVVAIVKNRLDPGHNSAETGGYRDLNLQLSFKVLNGTAYAGFVFELQIILHSFLAIKSDEGHQRYIRCRNLRGD